MKPSVTDDTPLKFMGQYFSILSGNFHSYPIELQKEILETENKVLKKKATATELEQLVSSNPDIPEYKILLFLVYDNQGRNAKSFETAQLTVNEHPGYLAGRCYLGNHYVLHDESDKALQLFNGFVALQELFFERTGFLSTEEDDYLFMGITYFASVHNIPQAARRLETLKTRNPDYPFLDIAQRIVEHARRNRNVKLFKEWEPKRRSVEYTDRTLPQVQDWPIFENPEINEFYHNNLSFNSLEINSFLVLPRESFIRDLERVIVDARQRYKYFFYDDDEEMFPDNADSRCLIHALLFLTECRAEGSLPLILGLLEEDESFYFDWFDEYFNESMVPAIYQLGHNQLEKLKSFILEPNLTLYARDAVSNAVSYIALHQPERRSEVIEWFEEVFHYFIDHHEDDRIIDTNLIGCMVIYCTEIKALELLETIRTLFEHDLLSIDFCGPFEDVEADLSGSINDNDKEPLLTIFEQYDYFRDDMEELYDDDGDDEKDAFEEADSYDLPIPEKGLASSVRSFNDIPQMPATVAKTPGRNDPCPCGSGKKYKKCCLGKGS